VRVEWVETTGRSIEEAKDAALDQLGVDEDEAEFEILEEPRAWLFGRLRGEARVRARVRPRRPPAKTDRRRRRRRSGGGRASERGAQGGAAVAADAARREGREGIDTVAAGKPTNAETSEQAGRTEAGVSRRPAAESARSDGPEQQGVAKMAEVDLNAQADIVEDFLDGLLDAFSLDGEIGREDVGEDTVEVRITGDDLGLLIGPKGATLTALQELARTVVQRRADGPVRGRVRLDVAGYRQKRRAALERFARQVAAEVLETGTQKVLEPMGPADRKVVHDTVNQIDGVSTVSEGEEPRRRVVIVPSPE
jgi:spoIIIJ-associated protein